MNSQSGKATISTVRNQNTVVITRKTRRSFAFHHGLLSSAMFSHFSGMPIENAFLGKMTADLHWEASTNGECTLVANMKGEDGKTAQLRRSLVAGAEPETLLMETIVDGSSMSQRYECEERPKPVAQAAQTHEVEKECRVAIEPVPGTGVDPAGRNSNNNNEDEDSTIQESQPQLDMETCVVHLDYIQSKFPWPLASACSCIACTCFACVTWSSLLRQSCRVCL
jgi:hypothetical protein